MFFVLAAVLGLQAPEIVIEPVEPFFPELAIAIEPIVDAFEGRRLEPTRAPLRLATACDQPGALEHLEVLGNCRPTDVERLGQFGYRRFAERKPRQDRAAGGIG